MYFFLTIALAHMAICLYGCNVPIILFFLLIISKLVIRELFPLIVNEWLIKLIIMTMEKVTLVLLII